MVLFVCPFPYYFTVSPFHCFISFHLNNEIVMQELTLQHCNIAHTYCRYTNHMNWICQTKLLVRCHLNKWYRISVIRQNECDFSVVFYFPSPLHFVVFVRTHNDDFICEMFVVREFAYVFLERHLWAIEYEKLLCLLLLFGENGECIRKTPEASGSERKNKQKNKRKKNFTELFRYIYNSISQNVQVDQMRRKR